MPSLSDANNRCGRLKVSWFAAAVTPLSTRPVQCFSYLEVGHVLQRCETVEIAAIGSTAVERWDIAQGSGSSVSIMFDLGETCRT